MGSGPQSLKPLTIKQLQDADTNSDGRLVIEGREVSQFSFVACIRGIKDISTGTDYLLEDGTSSISARCWPDKNITSAK